MTNIVQYNCFRSWLHDATLLDKHLCFCFDVAEGIDMKISELDQPARRGPYIMTDVVLRCCNIAVC